ncbi:MAG: tetratricopeptide repeat protein [Pseudomonadales bacterium]
MREILNLMRAISLLCLPWILVACGTVPVSAPVEDVNQPPISSQPGEVSTPTPTFEPAEPVIQPRPAAVDSVAEAPAAVASLLQRAQQQEQDGDSEAAIASLERAVRIAPRYPESYFRLAELRYQQGSYSQARSLAQKTLSLGAEGWLRGQAQALVDKTSAH